MDGRTQVRPYVRSVLYHSAYCEVVAVGFRSSGASASGESWTPNQRASVGAMRVIGTTPRSPTRGTSGPAITSDAFISGRAGSNPWPPRVAEGPSSDCVPVVE